jgi:thiosulfate/3-mercaptopyruvate sulfurtransferase
MLLAAALTAATAAAAPVFVEVAEATRLLDAGAAVLDTRSSSDWRAGHVRGSASIDWKDHREGILRDGRLTADTQSLADALGKMGVDDHRPVLVMGAGKDGWGEEGRVFWMLDYLGHADVHIVDGGWPIWTSRGGAVTVDAAAPRPGQFTPRPDPTKRTTLQEVADGLGGSAVFWDTREQREYDGQTPYLEPRGGHLPGAKHLWFHDLMRADGTLRERRELRTALASQGLTIDATVIPYCTGGVRSGFAYAVLRELGSTSVSNYDGSMWEWSAAPERPLE